MSQSNTPIANRILLLVLRHPQESKQELGTGALTVESLAKAQLRTGLSWSNLTKAVGAPADPKRWAVLYLGAASSAGVSGTAPVVAVNRNGEPLADQKSALANIDGIVVLDGNWAQSKTLWWRNPWLLKLRRLILVPDQPSRYGKLRREPRKVSLATIEATALCLSHLEKNPDIRAALDNHFLTFLNQFRQNSK